MTASKLSLSWIAQGVEYYCKSSSFHISCYYRQFLLSLRWELSLFLHSKGLFKPSTFIYFFLIFLKLYRYIKRLLLQNNYYSIQKTVKSRNWEMWSKLSCTPIKQTCLYNTDSLASVLTKFHYGFCINTHNFHGQIQEFFIRGVQTYIDCLACWQLPFFGHYTLFSGEHATNQGY